MSHFRLPKSALALGLLALGLLAGCANQGLNAPAHAPGWQQTDLYFAIARVGNSAQGEATWHRFVTDEVIPRFPDGFTIVPARGTWQTREAESPPELETRVLVVVHPQSPEMNARIEAIRRAWRALTSAKSVLRVDRKAEVSF